MVYHYELRDGSIGELDICLVENSQMIQNFIKNHEVDVIPLLNDCCSMEIIKNAVMMLRYLLYKEGGDLVDSFMVIGGKDDVVDVLNFSDYCDIEILRNYLIDFFASLIGKQKKFENLEELFRS